MSPDARQRQDGRDRLSDKFTAIRMMCAGARSVAATAAVILVRLQRDQR